MFHSFFSLNSLMNLFYDFEYLVNYWTFFYIFNLNNHHFFYLLLAGIAHFDFHLTKYLSYLFVLKMEIFFEFIQFNLTFIQFLTFIINFKWFLHFFIYNYKHIIPFCIFQIFHFLIFRKFNIEINFWNY